MPVLKKTALESYLKARFGPSTQLLAYGPIGKETSGARYKQYGYGAPVRWAASRRRSSAMARPWA